MDLGSGSVGRGGPSRVVQQLAHFIQTWGPAPEGNVGEQSAPRSVGSHPKTVLKVPGLQESLSTVSILRTRRLREPHFTFSLKKMYSHDGLRYGHHAQASHPMIESIVTCPPRWPLAESQSWVTSTASSWETTSLTVHRNPSKSLPGPVSVRLPVWKKDPCTGQLGPQPCRAHSCGTWEVQGQGTGTSGIFPAACLRSREEGALWGPF